MYNNKPSENIISYLNIVILYNNNSNVLLICYNLYFIMKY